MSKQIGQDKEAMAKAYLLKQGLKFIDANIRFAFGEIDLLMKHKNCLVFIEVKFRSNQQFGGALASVTKTKQMRIKRAASAYIQKHKLHCQARFDVVAIDNDNINWIEHAFY